MKKKLLVIKILKTLFLVLIKIIKIGIAPKKIFFAAISWENVGDEKGLAKFFLQPKTIRKVSHFIFGVSLAVSDVTIVDITLSEKICVPLMLLSAKPSGLSHLKKSV